MIYKDCEIWKEIPEFPGYEVSNQGRVRSFLKQGGSLRGYVSQPHFVKSYPRKDGYLTCRLRNKDREARHVKIHKLVANLFLGKKPEGLQICHNDGNRQNNHVENLRYDTAKSNGEDKVKHGKSTFGEKSYSAKLTDSLVLSIRKKFAEGRSSNSLAKEYGLGHTAMQKVIDRDSWKHLP